MAKSKKLQLISMLLTICLGQVMAADTCASSQVLLDSTCIECNSLFYGCTRCSVRDDSIGSVQCDTCDFGLLLLSVTADTFNTNSAIMDLTSYSQEYQRSMCVERCEDFAYNFVSNFETRKCEYCGAGCLLCSPVDGCLSDHRIDHGYRYTQDVSEYPSATFPFSDSEPSADFLNAQSCADDRCDRCDTTDNILNEATGFYECDSCPTWVSVQYEGQQAVLPCQLCDLPDVQNCYQCDPDAPSLCQSCLSGYYVDKDINECVECAAGFGTADGCLRCNHEECLECQDGYYLYTDAETGLSACGACDLTAFNAQYDLFPDRCSRCSEGAPTECSVCDIGFLFSESNPSSCELKCEANQYPSVTYADLNDNENVLASTECLYCSDSCASCMGPGSNQCTSCNLGQWLDVKDTQTMAGFCVDRVTNTDTDGVTEVTPYIDIFVANDGSTTPILDVTPVARLEDALQMAKNQAARFVSSQIAVVTIHLFAGDHYLLENRGYTSESYQMSHFNYTQDNLNYELTIKPLFCSVSSAEILSSQCVTSTADSVTIYNKRREKFRIEAAVSLTLEQVIIDALDSVLHTVPDGSSLPTCLNEERRCCAIDASSGTVSNFYADTLTEDFSCSDSYDALFSSMEMDCFANWPRSLIKMRYGVEGDISAVNEVTIIRSTIQNIFYAMNSLVSFTTEGGHVHMQDSDFQRISICGSLINPTISELGWPDIANNITPNILSLDQITAIESIMSNQLALTPTQTPLNHYRDEPPSAALCSSPDSSYCTTILVESCTFSQIPYNKPLMTQPKVVDPANGLRFQGYIVTLTGDENGQSSLEMYASTFNSLQAQYDGNLPYLSMLSEDSDHVGLNTGDPYYTDFWGTATRQVQVEGPIIVKKHSGQIVIQDNTFFENVSYRGSLQIDQDSGPIVIAGNHFTGNAALLDGNAISLRMGEAGTQCGGVYISGNTIDYNIGTNSTVGGVLHQCLTDSAGWTYNEYLDTYEYDEVLEMTVSTASETTLSVETQSASYTPALTQVASQSLVLSSNTIGYNFCGDKRSIVQIEGVPTVTFSSNTIEFNENILPNSYRLKSQLFALQSDSTYPLDIESTLEIREKCRAITHIRASSTVSISDDTYNSNYVIDSFSPYGSDQSDVQSNALFFHDFVGTNLTLSGINFLKNQGIQSSTQSLSLLDSVTGFHSTLIQFLRVTLVDLTFNQMTFTQNTAYQHADETINQQPQLFKLSQDLFTSETFEVTISSLLVSQNTFRFSDSMFTTSLYYVTFDNLQLLSNEAESVLNLAYLANTNQVFFTNGCTFSANRVGAGAVILVTESKAGFELTSTGLAATGNSVTPHLTFDGAVFESNQGDSVTQTHRDDAKTSCLLIEGGQEPWLDILITNGNFASNQGTLTNEIWFDLSLNSIDLNTVIFDINNLELSTTKLAQVLFKRPDSLASITVFACTFTCSSPALNINNIWRYEIENFIGRPSLFRLGDSVNSEVMETLEFEVSGTNSIEKGLRDPTLFTMQFSTNIYTSCTYQHEGSIFYLEQGARVKDIGSRFESCSALRGGIAFVKGDGTYLHIEAPITSIQLIYAYDGGLIYLEDGATAELTDADVFSCKAYRGVVAFVTNRSHFIMRTNQNEIKANDIFDKALFYVQDGSQIWIKDVQFVSNTGEFESMIFYGINNRQMYHITDGTTKRSSSDSLPVSKFESCVLDRFNLGDDYEGKLFTVFETSLLITDSRFQSIEGISEDTYGIHVTQGEVELIDTDFSGPSSDFFYREIFQSGYNINGALIAAYAGSIVTITRGTISNGRGTFGGCILLLTESQITVDSITFTNCAAQLGGAIYADGHLSLDIKNSLFYDNIAYAGFGQNIYSAHVQERFSMESSELTSYHNSVYASGYEVYMRDNKFTGDGENTFRVSSISYRVDGGGIYLNRVAKVSIDAKNTFSRLQARNGGAIYMEMDRTSTVSLNAEAGANSFGRQEFTSITISNCQAEFNGAGIYVKNPINAYIWDTTFKKNLAPNGEGGGVYYDCIALKEDFDRGAPCRLTIKNSQFSGNEAQVGGAIRWTQVEMITPEDAEFKPTSYNTNRFENNKADIYGREIAGLAQELIMFPDEDTYLKYYNQSTEAFRKDPVPLEIRSQFFNNHLIQNVMSGGIIPPVYMGLIDKYGQIVAINRGSRINFSLIPVEKRNPDDFDTRIIGVTDFFSAYGTFNMSGMGLLSNPGDELRVKLTVEAIDLQVPTNRKYIENQLNTPLADGSTSFQLDMELQVRPCEIGEGLSETGACYLCTFGTLQLVAPTEEKQCEQCDKDKAYCLGGTKVGPKEGHWRKSNETLKFFECPNREACLGMDENEPNELPGNQVGLCDTENGYYGVMCNSCLPTFSTDGPGRCRKCDSMEIFTIPLMIIALIIGIVVLVRMALKGAIAKESTSSVFTKILMNHLQMLLITADFDMEWPENIKALFAIAEPINTITDAFVNFDCFMPMRDINDIDPYEFRLPEDEIRVYAQKVMIMATLPVVIAVMSYTVWWIISKINGDMSELQPKFIATLVFLLFLIHPALTKRMVDVFNCRNIDDVSRLQIDLQTVCYEDIRHYQIAYYVALPCLIVWSLGIPAGVALLMSKEKDRLTTYDAKRKFGFLYNGYKKHNYFWEIVIMYRKILCIFIAVMVKPFGVIVQALVLLVFLMGFLNANNTERPFLARQLNDIESLSLLTQIVTIFCGIFFISAKPTKDDDNFDHNKDFYLSENGTFMFFCVVAFCNTLFIVTWISKFLEVGREMIKNSLPQLYVIIFLCGRKEQIEAEEVKQAQITKRERIISNIEETILYMSKMKKLYINNIYFEDHNRFMRLLYQIQTERNQIDITEKRNNYYIQGDMARERKFDPERMKELKNEMELDIEDQIVSIMEQQRQGLGENGRLKQTPYLKSLIKLNKTSSMKSSKRRQTRLFMIPNSKSHILPNADSPLSISQSINEEVMSPLKKVASEKTAHETSLSSFAADKNLRKISTLNELNGISKHFRMDTKVLSQHEFYEVPEASEESQDSGAEEIFDKGKKVNKGQGRRKKKRQKRANQADLEGMALKSRNLKSEFEKQKQEQNGVFFHEQLEHKKVMELPDHLQNFKTYGGKDRMNLAPAEIGQIEAYDSIEERILLNRQVTDRMARDDEAITQSQVDKQSKADSSSAVDLLSPGRSRLGSRSGSIAGLIASGRSGQAPQSEYLKKETQTSEVLSPSFRSQMQATKTVLTKEFSGDITERAEEEGAGDLVHMIEESKINAERSSDDEFGSDALNSDEDGAEEEERYVKLRPPSMPVRTLLANMEVVDRYPQEDQDSHQSRVSDECEEEKSLKEMSPQKTPDKQDFLDSPDPKSARSRSSAGKQKPKKGEPVEPSQEQIKALARKAAEARERRQQKKREMGTIGADDYLKITILNDKGDLDLPQWTKTEDQTSQDPADHDATADQLEVYEDKSGDNADKGKDDDKSSFCTDSSMRDYDIDFEPTEFAFTALTVELKSKEKIQNMRKMIQHLQTGSQHEAGEDADDDVGAGLKVPSTLNANADILLNMPQKKTRNRKDYR